MSDLKQNNFGDLTSNPRIQPKIWAYHGRWRYDELCQAVLGHDDSLTPTKICETTSLIDMFFGYPFYSFTWSFICAGFGALKRQNTSEDWQSLATGFVCSEEFWPDPFYVSNMPTRAKNQEFAWCSSNGKNAVDKHMRVVRKKKGWAADFETGEPNCHSGKVCFFSCHCADVSFSECFVFYGFCMWIFEYGVFVTNAFRTSVLWHVCELPTMGSVLFVFTPFMALLLLWWFLCERK